MRLKAENFQSFCRSQFFLSVSQNNFGNKILFLIPNFRTGSSSSGDNLTDDSGIHSKSTSKDSPRLVTKSIINYDQPQKSIIKYDQPVQPVKIERVAIGRRPVRKLPAVPSSKQAHIGGFQLLDLIITEPKSHITC